ncbi:hypothetical protein FPV67DRAFT_792189 [Lyophyllum atratum]|nr:hypothetical protein FPV67DRAFT_792189 [Lyophyllum atratum]
MERSPPPVRAVHGASPVVGAVMRRQVAEEVLPLLYDAAPRPPPFPSPAVPPSASSTPSLPPLNQDPNPPTQTPHNLALLFILFTFGALIDTFRAAPPNNSKATAGAYYELTKAALGLAPVMERPLAVATLHQPMTRSSITRDGRRRVRGLRLQRRGRWRMIETGEWGWDGG